MTSPLAGTQPLHDRVREAIAAQITSGAIPPGTRLQSERELADQMGVSRVTVRRALDALAEDGLVRAARGSGRFVSLPALVEPSNVLLSFTELGAERGLQATRAFSGRASGPQLAEAEVLTVAPGADVFELDRLRMLDGVAVALDHTRIPVALAPELPTIDFRRRRCTPRWTRPAPGSCAPTTPPRPSPPMRAGTTAGRRRRGSPLLLARTTSYDASDRVVELGETAYRSDRYRFRATLVRKPQPGGGTTT